MNDTSAKRLLNGKAWDDFCEQVRQAGHVVGKFADADELDQAEWYRFMTRLLRNGLERFVENCEPERPRLRDAPWRQSINFQSPDQDHFLAEFIDGRCDYRIRGRRGSAPYFVMASWTAPQPADLGAHDWAPLGTAGLATFNPAMLRTTGFLQSQSIDYGADGAFEVIVSREPPPGSRNWLKMTEDCVGVLIRVVYHERFQESAPEFHIERVDRATPVPLKPARLSEGLAKAGQVVLAYAELVRSWWQEDLSKRPNRLRFSRAVYLSNGGVPDRHHGFGAWRKAAGEALVLSFYPPACDYWIFQLCNLWQENLDNYEDGQGYVNKYNARYEPDGLVRIVVSDEDPGLGGNWINPVGHVHGGMSLRVILTQSQPPPITLHCIPLEALKREGLAALKPEAAIQTGEIGD